LDAHVVSSIKQCPVDLIFLCGISFVKKQKSFFPITGASVLSANFFFQSMHAHTVISHEVVDSSSKVNACCHSTPRGSAHIPGAAHVEIMQH
jgi:hypothetical protein